MGGAVWREDYRWWFGTARQASSGTGGVQGKGDVILRMGPAVGLRLET